MDKIFKSVIVTTICFMAVSRVDAGPSYFNFVEIPVHSAVVGMGSAGTSLGRGGVNFYNPAGLSIADKSFVTFDFTRIFDDLGRAYIESGWVFPDWYFGGTFQTQQDEFQVTDETGIKPGAYSHDRATQASLLLGIKRERYGLGVSLNGVQQTIGEYKAYGFSGSIGMILTIVPDHIFVGVSAINAAGRHNRFFDGKEKLKSERFPATIRGGLSWKDTLMQRFPVTLAADVVYNYNDQLLTVPVGVDFNLLPPLAVRIGKRFNHPTELFSMGIGLNWQNIAFDATFVPMQFVTDLKVKRAFALTYYLAAPKKKVTPKSEKVQIIPDKPESVLIPVEFVTDSVRTDSAHAAQKKLDAGSALPDSSGKGSVNQPAARNDSLTSATMPDSTVIDSQSVHQPEQKDTVDINKPSVQPETQQVPSSELQSTQNNSVVAGTPPNPAKEIPFGQKDSTGVRVVPVQADAVIKK